MPLARSLYRLCAAGRAGHRDARRRQVLSVAAAGRDRSPRRGRKTRPACARPTTRSVSAARSNIRSTGVAVALRREGDTLADLRVAFTGTNPRPVLLAGTAELCGGPLDDAGAQGARRAGARPDHGDEDDVHARPLPPPRRRRAGAPAGAAAVRRPNRCRCRLLGVRSPGLLRMHPSRQFATRRVSRRMGMASGTP